MIDPRTRRILQQHVATDQLLGIEVVPRASHGPSPTADLPPAEDTRQSSTMTEVPLTDPASSIDATASAAPAFAASTPAPEPLPAEQRVVALQAMDEQQVRGCTKCGLCQSRTQTVFGEGAGEASIMFVGEGPGFDEDRSGRPFVGKAGQLLEKMIQAMGYAREEVYITNVVKCRPPNNRTPTPDEAHACWDYLRGQIEIVRPAVIVTLGGPATKRLADVTTGITRIRGQWHTCQHVNPPVPVMPTFHPSYVLRSYTRETRAKVWSDLQQVLEYVGRNQT